MKALVTGSAGFIGSQLVSRLLADGWSVVGVDCFAPNYPRSFKEQNLSGIVDAFLELDLAEADLDALVSDVDVVYHLAAIPGVRSSWGDDFDGYVRNNIHATRRLLDAVVANGVPRVVYASSSSVYGDLGSLGAVQEGIAPEPFSPYAVSKLSAEHLCRAYAGNYGFAALALRLFTVYGPRQRPDMALHRIIEAVLGGDEFVRFGSGEQERDFTFVGDVVDGFVRGAGANLPSGLTVANIAGGSIRSLNAMIGTVESVMGKAVPLVDGEVQRGDVTKTDADASLASEVLGWSPETSFEDGVRAQVDWHLARRRS